MIKIYWRGQPMIFTSLGEAEKFKELKRNIILDGLLRNRFDVVRANRFADDFMEVKLDPIWTMETEPKMLKELRRKRHKLKEKEKEKAREHNNYLWERKKLRKKREMIRRSKPRLF